MENLKKANNLICPWHYSSIPRASLVAQLYAAQCKNLEHAPLGSTWPHHFGPFTVSLYIARSQSTSQESNAVPDQMCFLENVCV